MVSVRVFCIIIFTETLTLGIVIMVNLATLPPVMTFDTEVIIALYGQL
jgi:hypothetical protein